MKFRYRYVPFGSKFTAAAGQRQDAAAEPKRLFENELAVDVGGVCLGHDSDLAVIDHHYFRADGRQFPSAAAAVLHQASAIAARFRGRQDDFWLVSHRAPDFDAYSSMYLARCLLEGVIPGDGWEQIGVSAGGWSEADRKVDWFGPDVGHLPMERRWPILLAANAAAVDQCRRMACPRERALHSVLYAAWVRGRGYDDETSGATELFDEVRASLGNGLNPLYDSVLENSAAFAPELRLLDRELPAYRRDLARSHQSIVHLKKAATRFDEWFKLLTSTPLYREDGTLDPVHLDPPGHGYRQVDAVFLRDPESILFKEWARTDTDNSSMRRGFLFTAIAYSKGRSGNPVNESDYFFSIDPEQAGGMHLYDVWTRLQNAEIRALDAAENVARRERLKIEHRPPRAGFEERAEGVNKDFFSDPWFDGSSYACTIVPTPSEGTYLRPGIAADLSDDAAARVVRDELEGRIFIADGSPLTPTAREAAGEAPYRFEARRLDGGVSILEGNMAGQIARTLWRALQKDATEHFPVDFDAKHVLKTNEWVGVWSRRGIAIAYKASATEKVAATRQVFDRLVTLAQQVEKLPALLQAASRESAEFAGLDRHARRHRKEAESPFRPVQELGEQQLQQMVELRRSLADPECILASRFFEASKIEEILRSARDVYLAAVEQSQSRALAETARETSELQSKLEWLEIFIIGVYSVELAAHVGHAFRFDDEFLGFSLIGFALMVPAIAFRLLRPYEHPGMEPGRLRRAIVLLAILFGLFLGIGLATRRLGHEEPQKKELHAGEPPATLA
jgi:hypothetical protein